MFNCLFVLVHLSLNLSLVVRGDKILHSFFDTNLTLNQDSRFPAASTTMHIAISDSVTATLAASLVNISRLCKLNELWHTDGDIHKL